MREEEPVPTAGLSNAFAVLRRRTFGFAAEECWRIVDPILTAWADDEVPLDEYAAGGNGPANWDTNCTLHA
nr:hypothetical protein [Paeniglutamicibacter quisquiliarum]